MLYLFYKNFLITLLANFFANNIALSMAKLTVKLIKLIQLAKQKHCYLIKKKVNNQLKNRI